MELETLYELLKRTSDKVDGVSVKLAESQGLHKETHRRLDKIESATEELKIENVKQSKDIEENKENLVLHMKRSDTLEQIVFQNKDIMHQEIDKIKVSHTNSTAKMKNAINKRLEPIEEPKKVRKFLIDIFLKIGGGAGAMYGILKLYTYFKGNPF